MTSRFRARIAPFTRGYNGVADPTRCGEGEALECRNADIRSGVLQGAYGPGTTVATLAAQLRFIYWHQGVGWLTSNFYTSGGYMNWALRDADDAAGNAVSYVTQMSLPATYAVPRVYVGASNYPMGLTAPAAAPTVVAGAGGNRQYAYTYVQEDGSGNVLLESNPSARTIAYAAGGTITTVASADTRVTHRYVYGTQEGDPNGLLYYLGKTTVANYLDAAAPTKTRPLDWAAGGNADDDIAPDDHSPAGAMTAFSNRMHGADTARGAAAGTPGTGILFGAIGQYVVWSMSNSPQYWPTVNTFKLQGIVQALCTVGSQTFAFLADQIWAFSGIHHHAIKGSQTASRMGVRLGCGRTVISTPYGIIFLAREGLAIFDGTTSRLLVEDLVGLADFNQADVNDWWVGAYHDGFYYLSQNDITYAFDLRSLPAVRVVRHDVAAWAYHYEPPAINVSGLAEGLYVYHPTTGTVKPWRPLDEAAVGGQTQQTATWRTPLFALGDPMREKRMQRVRVDGSGSVTLSFYADPSDAYAGTPKWTTTVTAGSGRHVMVPSNVRGRYLQVLASVPAGSVLRDVELEGVIVA